MIGQASKCLEKNKISYIFDYIMIDEFQDIGVGRFNLIDNIKKQNYYSKTFCVGDDWQAIYRFAGGDINILFDFEKYFGDNSEKLFLTESFRLNSQLAKISNDFISKNPKQSSKKIHSSKNAHKPIKIYTKKSI